jgi:hypothetical protein
MVIEFGDFTFEIIDIDYQKAEPAWGLSESIEFGVILIDTAWEDMEMAMRLGDEVWDELTSEQQYHLTQEVLRRIKNAD